MTIPKQISSWSRYQKDRNAKRQQNKPYINKKSQEPELHKVY